MLSSIPITQAKVIKGHSHHSMMMNENTMVMGQNIARLPDDCPKLEHDLDVTINVGREYAKDGDVFGYDMPVLKLEGCSRVTVTLNNKDQVRHQWMVHGLPRYIYNDGMFHLEANGGYSITGTFIVPSHDAEYFAHCDMAQHTEKGLTGGVIVGAGKDESSLSSVIVATLDKINNIPALLALILGALITLVALRKF